MHDFNTHTRYLADIDKAVHDARQYEVRLSKQTRHMFVACVALILGMVAFGSGWV